MFNPYENQISANARIEFHDGVFPENHTIYNVPKLFPSDLTIEQSDKEFKLWSTELFAKFGGDSPEDIKSIQITVSGAKGVWEY